MAMAIPRGALATNLYNLLPRAFQGSSFTALHAARTTALSWSAILPSASITIPAITLNIPGAISEIWEGILRAVPKKKTSHMKKRHRQLAGKALKDVQSVVQCPACGKPKKAHMLCPYCVAEIGGRPVGITSAKRKVKAEDGGVKREGSFSTEGILGRREVNTAEGKTQEHFEIGEADLDKPPTETFKEQAGPTAEQGSTSKQYLSAHTIDAAHRTDIFALAVTPTQILSASGESSIKIYDTVANTTGAQSGAQAQEGAGGFDYPIAQSLQNAHKIGCHHLVCNRDGGRAVSVGFGGEVRVWRLKDGVWGAEGDVDTGATVAGGEKGNGKKAGEVWAVALSAEGRYLVATTQDGRVGVWDLDATGESESGKGEVFGMKVREMTTKGSFGMCIDLSPDGRFTASGHESGNIYIFSNDTARLLHSLPGLIKPIRTLAFSPGGKLLAAAGDARVIGLYDYASGEQVANLKGHDAWITSLSWSHTGEYLLSGGLDGKVKVWSVERRECVATHSETDKALWAVRWLPKGVGRSERFAAAGGNRSVAFYREATGG